MLRLCDALKRAVKTRVIARYPAVLGGTSVEKTLGGCMKRTVIREMICTVFSSLQVAQLQRRRPLRQLRTDIPSQPLEIVAHTAPGGGTDQFVRLMAEIFTREKTGGTAPIVSNRVGGGGAIAYSYVKGKRGDPHVLLAVATGNLHVGADAARPRFLDRRLHAVAFLAMDPQVVAVTGDGKFNNVRN
jgi:tripartite-type tricarboxylate transporter receptor subunit TctC